MAHIRRLALATVSISTLMLAATAAEQASAGANGNAHEVALRQQRLYLQRVLTVDPVASVTGLRRVCASGEQPQRIAMTRKAGLASSPDATELCVAALARLGREGALSYLQDTHGSTSAIRFDAGFVTAYVRRQPIPANLPTMGALKPLAERCLAQAEPNHERCYSAGYAFGLRVAQGEVPAVVG